MDWVISKVKFFELPLAIVTIIVSPMALEIPKTKDATIPEKAAGITTRLVTSNFVEPSAKAPSLRALGTELIASSESEAIMGMIMIPITIPGLRILVASKPGIHSLKTRVTNVRAKNPYTVVGMPARISTIGFNTFLARSEAYSLK